MSDRQLACRYKISIDQDWGDGVSGDQRRSAKPELVNVTCSPDGEGEHSLTLPAVSVISPELKRISWFKKQAKPAADNTPALQCWAATSRPARRDSIPEFFMQSSPGRRILVGPGVFSLSYCGGGFSYGVGTATSVVKTG